MYRCGVKIGEEIIAIDKIGFNDNTIAEIEEIINSKDTTVEINILKFVDN